MNTKELYKKKRGLIKKLKKLSDEIKYKNALAKIIKPVEKKENINWDEMSRTFLPEIEEIPNYIKYYDGYYDLDFNERI